MPDEVYIRFEREHKPSIVWKGHWVGDQFHVADVIDGGVSRAELGGASLEMMVVPRDRITACGGEEIDPES